MQGNRVDWHLYPVDDGCPYGSGQVAREIASEHNQNHKIRVMFLDEHCRVGNYLMEQLAFIELSLPVMKRLCKPICLSRFCG